MSKLQAAFSDQFFARDRWISTKLRIDELLGQKESNGVYLCQDDYLIEYEDVLADVKQRDYQDTHRAAAPLKQADDAVLLDTSELNFEQSFEAMKKIITEKVR